jgi:hypothetical protein
MIRYSVSLFISLVVVTSIIPTACVPVSSTGSTSGSSTTLSANEVLYDQTFQQNVRSIRLLLPDGVLWSSAIRIGDPTPVVMVFDILELNGEGDVNDYRAKIIHCNADWRQSSLPNMDFLFDFNEFLATGEAFSYNTQVQFTQYRLPLPPVKLPGNYIIWVYEGRDESNVVFTKRLMVYDQLIGVGAEVNRSSGASERVTNHQIDFVVDYSNIDILNPLQDISVVVRQNYRWFNAITDIKPSFVRQDRQQLEYRHFDLENNFYAGNEYRFFDLRTLNALGQNVGDIRRNQAPVEAFLLADRDRSREVYSLYEDMNGGYVIGNLDNRGDELSADYVKTHFFLEVDQPIIGDVYVVGAFNNRVLTADNRMVYDPQLKGYTADILLKQGFYNYQYYVVDGQNDNPYVFEGSFYEVENQYEVLVYTRPIGTRGDILAGYTNIVSSDLGR